MLVWVHRVDADSYTMRSCGFYFFGINTVDHGAVGAEHDHKLSVGGVTDDLVDVGTKKWFSTSENEKRVRVNFRDLIDHLEAFLRIQLVGFEAATKLCIEIAVVAI